jgi:hypothetical protein
MIMQTLINMMLKVLSPINGWKTWAGIGLAVINLAFQYLDILPAALPPQVGDVVASVMIGLGLGDRMGKERAANGE